jgi:UDP:flavonoid glycosyltransferase YjiC (YdhE family)
MRFLFTSFEGGGHVPPAIVMATHMRARGHDVLFVADEANRTAATRAGLTFEPWSTAPNRTAGGRADDPLDDWKRRWPPAVVRSVCRAVMTGPADAYAVDTLRLLDGFMPDLVVTNELLFGVQLACEARKQAVAVLTANLWCFPTRPDVPPFGPGWRPAATPFEARREISARRLISTWYDTGLTDLNAARRRFGLNALDRTLEQLDTCGPVVLGTSAAFDFGSKPPPAPFVYAGPLLDLKPPPRSPGPLIDRRRPNVLVSFSTTFQRQAAVMARCMRALENLDVNVIVTTGPAVNPDQLPGTANARVIRFSPHDDLVPFCDLVICHGGHGTLMRPLLLGVPVLCLPMGRDHPDNGRRLAERGAGLMISRAASQGRIRQGARRILQHASFRTAAVALGRRIREASDRNLMNALAALEAAASGYRNTRMAAQDAEVSAPERRPASEAPFGTDRICATLVQGSDGSIGQVSASRQRNQMD